MILLPDDHAVYISHPRCGSHTMFAVLKKYYGGLFFTGDGYHSRILPESVAGWYVFSTCRNPYSLAVSIWRATTSTGSDFQRERWKFSEHMQDADADTYLDGRAAGSTESRSFGAFARLLAKTDFTDPNYLLMDCRFSPLAYPQHIWFSLVVYQNVLCRVMRLERLEAEFRLLPFWHGPNFLPRAANSTSDGKGPPWQKFYEQPGVAADIEKWAGTDFEMFGYRKGNYRD